MSLCIWKILNDLLTSRVIPQWLSLLRHELANGVHRVSINDRHCFSHVHTLRMRQGKYFVSSVQRSVNRTSERVNDKWYDDPRTETEYREVQRLVAVLASRVLDPLFSPQTFPGSKPLCWFRVYDICCFICVPTRTQSYSILFGISLNEEHFSLSIDNDKQ